MNNLDMNKNEEKINLIKQIYEYNKKGYNFDKHYLISDDINKLKYQLALLQNNEHKLNIHKELKFYELLFKINSSLSGKPIPPKEELLKYCYGSKEYYEYHKE